LRRNLKNGKKKQRYLTSIAFIFHHRLGTKKRISYGIFLFLFIGERTPYTNSPIQKNRDKIVNVR